ncbi:hypothetical protein VTJ83DRAFT_2361 [Remersonia thermophila]|uniref:DUF7603 domain-containing protein n=1 Tax=Remersonia thermophila TaxID=72144 RepID=A0ABR4DIR9_9PEZI
MNVTMAAPKVLAEMMPSSSSPSSSPVSPSAPTSTRPTAVALLPAVPELSEPDTLPAASSEVVRVSDGSPPVRSGPHAPAPPYHHHHHLLSREALETFETLAHRGSSPEPSSAVAKASPLPSPRPARSLSLAQLSGPVKRKPLSATASPVAVRFSKGPAAYADLLEDLPRPEQRFARSFSVDSPTLYDFPSERALLPAVVPVAFATPTPSALSVAEWSASLEPSSEPSSPASVVSSIDPAKGAEDVQFRNTAAHHPAAAPTASIPPPTPAEDKLLSAETASIATRDSASPYEIDDLYSVPDSPRSADDEDKSAAAAADSSTTKTMSVFSRKPPPPHLNLQSITKEDEPAVPATASPLDPSYLNNKPLPKSPASSKLSAFFGWATSPSPSGATDYSDQSFSPLPSPESSPKRPTTAGTESYQARPISTPPQAPPHGAGSNSLQYCEQYLQTPPVENSRATPLGELEEMEDELKAISAELASSIRREMDLEDLVERLQEQINNPQAPGRRTSDYFSDSGYSSARFSDYDQTKEEISQIQRRAEQEKARLRLELTNKLQEERSRRRVLDQQIQELSKKASQFDAAQHDNADVSDRIKELESTCEDLRRRLSEEATAKNSLEDLLGVLRTELQATSNERDNLRDEVVPQLRSRVEGLEAQAAEQAKLAYDTSKLQQELQLLRSKNAELMLQQQQPPQPQPQTAAVRSSVSLGRSASISYRSSRAQSITRSNSTAAPRAPEPRDVLAERLKDVEAQRDALHTALKSLLERQELQNRENAKRIRQLEMERDRLLSQSPKKAGYEREVSKLRDEIAILRRRAEDAIEQKWQVEKGLAGLKMDLDRAEGEIASLRSLLKEKDILIPDAIGRPGSSYSVYSTASNAEPISSESLERAYHDLQAAYTDALERIKALEECTRPDEKTQLAMQRLEHSLASAVSDRDLARSEADAYHKQVESLQAAEKQHVDAERDLATQLEESARRIEDLAHQVRTQLEANASLRARLADTIARGEAEQRINTQRIARLQKRLRQLEEQVVAAQSAAEDRVHRHEEELAALKAAHNDQLQRLRDASGGLKSPRAFPPKSPLSPMFALRSPGARSVGSPAARDRLSIPQGGLLSPGITRSVPSSPRLAPAFRRGSTSPSNPDLSLSADAAALAAAEEDTAAQVEQLKRRVAELEGALASADAEMQEVVQRMSEAQIEVLRLQEERDEAARETRRLRRELEAEKMNAFEGRFRTLSTEVR